jgi:osmotically-inducible protein OsmY
VLQGTVQLQGTVDDESDAENALAVAGDVPGVVEVIDELTRA